ncbi:hypothetical protein [Bradyrhizobium sp. Cp5.3]
MSQLSAMHGLVEAGAGRGFVQHFFMRRSCALRQPSEDRLMD